MSRVIDLKTGRMLLSIKKGFRNWVSRFNEDFGPQTRLSDLSLKTLSFLAHDRENGPFYLYDLIMNLKGFGSGFEFNKLCSSKKMVVIDRHLFLLDRIRFECMKRLGWLESYPGEEVKLVELIIRFNEQASELHTKIPVLSHNHPDYERYLSETILNREAFVRRLIPQALLETQNNLNNP